MKRLLSKSGHGTTLFCCAQEQTVARTLGLESSQPQWIQAPRSVKQALQQGLHHVFSLTLLSPLHFKKVTDIRLTQGRLIRWCSPAIASIRARLIVLVREGVCDSSRFGAERGTRMQQTLLGGFPSTGHSSSWLNRTWQIKKQREKGSSDVWNFGDSDARAFSTVFRATHN